MVLNASGRRLARIRETAEAYCRSPRATLELQSNQKLKLAAWVDIRDTSQSCAERRQTNAIWIITVNAISSHDIRVIQQIECFCAKFQANAIADRKLMLDKRTDVINGSAAPASVPWAAVAS